MPHPLIAASLLLSLSVTAACVVDELQRWKQAEAAHRACLDEYEAEPARCDAYKSEATRAEVDYQRAGDPDRSNWCPFNWSVCSYDRGPAEPSGPGD